MKNQSPFRPLPEVQRAPDQGGAKPSKRRRIPWAIIRFVLFVTVLSVGSWWAYNRGLLDEYRPKLEHGWAVLTNNQDVDHSAHQTKTYTCPMHPQILKNKPGECPICGMDLVLKDVAPKPTESAESTYTCPMHPQILKNKPGECPICGMDLVKVETEQPKPTKDKKTTYTCPMHPQILKNKPGECPICGMTLVPVDEGESAEHEGHAEDEHPNEVRIDPAMLNNLGVRTEKASIRSLSRTLRVTGEITTDDSQNEVLQSWVGGRIEKVFIDAVGQKVKKGQPLVKVYSPQLLATSEELISALEYLYELREREALPQAILDTEHLVESTEKRLRLWGLAKPQIAKIKKTREAQTEVVVYATASGTVHKKMAYEGQYVKEGTPLYELINLGELWAYLSVFETDLGVVYKGMPIEFTTPAYDKRFYGQISEIEPMMDTKSRTGRVRVAIANRGSHLIPGMYIESKIRVAVSQGVPTVSNLAVIRTGKRDIVIVAKGGGRFYPQEVKLGRLADGYYPVLSGLAAGQEVVSQASFLIDSESQIKAALQQMKDGPAPGGHQH